MIEKGTAGATQSYVFPLLTNDATACAVTHYNIGSTLKPGMTMTGCITPPGLSINCRTISLLIDEVTQAYSVKF